MDLRYCAKCGEAFLLSKGSCVRCENTKTSEQNTGLKTAFLLGLLSIGVPSQGNAEPPKDQTSEKQSEDVRSSSTFTIAFAENNTATEKMTQEIETVVQSHLPAIEERHKQHKSNIIARKFSLQLQLNNGAVTQVEVLDDPNSTSPNHNSNPFLKAVVEDSRKWLFPKEITQKVIIWIVI